VVRVETVWPFAVVHVVLLWLIAGKGVSNRAVKRLVLAVVFLAVLESFVGRVENLNIQLMEMRERNGLFKNFGVLLAWPGSHVLLCVTVGSCRTHCWRGWHIGGSEVPTVFRLRHGKCF
jgi:fucose 4-O-acetylase-like acetyltransferase